jgi:hypothetical protein
VILSYVYDAMKVKKRFELMRVSFISFYLVLRLSLLPFSCCLLFLLPFLSFLLLLETMSTPSTCKSSEISLLFSSEFRMMAVRIKPEFITFKPSHCFLLNSEFGDPHCLAMPAAICRGCVLASLFIHPK